MLGIELRFPDNVNRVTWMVPILILGLAIFDTTLVCWSRLRRGLDPLRTPGRDHLSHRLVLLGLKPRDAVLVIYAVAILFALAGVAVSDAGPWPAYGIGGAVALTALLALAWLERPSLRARIEHAPES